MDTTLKWVALVAIAAIFALGGFPIVMSMHSDGAVDYCYTEYEAPPNLPPAYILYGHRNWRMDNRIGVFSSLDAAVEEAKKQNCPLNGVR